MSNTQLHNIDEIVETLFSSNINNISEKLNYPRTSFTKRFTQLTFLSAEEKMGK